MNIKSIILFTCLIFGIGCDQSTKEANTIIDNLELDLYETASTITAFRVKLDLNNDVQRLVQLKTGPATVLKRIELQGVSNVLDKMMAISAYVLEKRDHKEAITFLEDYLKSSPGNRQHVWGGMFAVRALLKLKNIPDGSGGYGFYDDAKIVEAIIEDPR